MYESLGDQFLMFLAFIYRELLNADMMSEYYVYQTLSTNGVHLFEAIFVFLSFLF